MKTTIAGVPACVCRWMLTVGFGLALHRPVIGQEVWSERSSGTAAALRGVTWGNGTFVAVGDEGVILRSQNGVQWERASSGTTATLSAVCHGRGLFVVVGRDGRILISPDGHAWGAATVGPTSLNTVTLGNSRFVAGGAQGTILVSDDGLTWMTPPTPGSLELNGVTAYGGLLVMVGFIGTAWTSPDAEVWTPRAVSSFPSFRSVLHFRNEFIATVGSGASMHRSTNGIDWVSTANGTGARLNSLTQGLDSIVAVGFDQTAFSSTNGVDWIERYRGTSAQLQGAAYGNGLFVAVGENGAILSSPEVAASSSVVSLKVLDAVASGATGNTARIQVSRTGHLDRPATVSFVFGGTAFPGIDYIAIPSSVTFPSGSDVIDLTVTPLARTESAPLRIMGLSLTVAAGVAANPAASSVAVFLHDTPEPETTRLSAVASAAARGAILELKSPAGGTVALEISPDLRDWTPALAVGNPFGQVLFTDPDALNAPIRHYRQEQ